RLPALALPISSCAMHHRVTNIRAQCRRMATRRRVTGRRRGGGGGFEETARRRTKEQQQEYFVGARLFLEHVTTSWSNELQSLASSPGHLGREPHFNSNAATARRASLTRTLSVPQAGPRA